MVGVLPDFLFSVVWNNNILIILLLLFFLRVHVLSVLVFAAVESPQVTWFLPFDTFLCDTEAPVHKVQKSDIRRDLKTIFLNVFSCQV